MAGVVAETGDWLLEIVKRGEAHRFRRPAQALDPRVKPEDLADLRLDQPQPPPWRATTRASPEPS